MLATLRDNLIRHNPSKVLFDKVLSYRPFDLIFEPIEHNPRKFIDIHLFARIDRLTFIIFEGMAEGSRIIVLLLALLQSDEQGF